MILPEFSEYFQGEARTHLLSILELSLAEDGPDLTTEGVFGPGDRLQAIIVAKEQTIIAGLPVIPLVMDLCAAHPEELSYTWQSLAKEGEEVAKGSIVARISGPARQVLRAERVILNFVSHLCGIANLTRRYAEKLEGTGVRLLDTRKTMPGLRYPDKYAVLCGGGHNHRRNLAEMLMLKDNHIDAAGGIAQAVAAARAHASFTCTIEVECETLDMVREAVDAGADIIMLDNMDRDHMARAIALIDGRAVVEASGNVDLDSIRELADLGVDVISSGALTHSAGILDLSLKHLRMIGDEGVAAGAADTALRAGEDK